MAAFVWVGAGAALGVTLAAGLLALGLLAAALPATLGLTNFTKLSATRLRALAGLTGVLTLLALLGVLAALLGAGLVAAF
ncbi:MAG TPA: hypothetical protein VFN29_03620 [Chiayiivirga sp.]|nr:hypothetical protein [Chiayiivirga sp.]